MSSSAFSKLPLRFTQLKLSLLAVAPSVVLAFLASPVRVNAQVGCSTTGTGTIYSSSDVIAVPNELNSDAVTKAGIYPSTITVPNTVTGAVSKIQVRLDSMDAPGGNSGASLEGIEVLLVAPNGEQLELMEAVGADTITTVDGLTVLIGDYVSSTDFPYMPSSASGDVDPPASGTACWAPSMFFDTSGFPGLTVTSSAFPYSYGSATLAGNFDGVGAAGAWKLYLIDDFGNPDVINGWDLFLTVNETAVGTTTTVSSNAQPVFNSSPSNSVTYTATVTASNSTTPTSGTVAFYANGSSTPISCSGGNQTLNGSGQATCVTTLSAGSSSQCSATILGSLPAWPTACQGNDTIEAAYSGSGSYSTSNGSLVQVVEVHPTQSTNQWCNTAPLAGGEDASPLAYPSIIDVSGYPAGTTVGNVSVQLEGATSSDGVDGEFLLVAPGGGANNLDFLDLAFAGNPVSNVSFTVSDSGIVPYDLTPTNGGTYVPYDGDLYNSYPSFPASLAPGVDSSIPAIPGTINHPQTEGGANAYTLEHAFSGAQANGDWALYTYSDAPTTLSTGWCVDFDINTGNPTVTTVTSTQQKATTGQSVTITATVTSGGSPVSSGTVTMVDTITGTTLVNAGTPNGSGQVMYTTTAFTEGDHKITATYNPSSGYNTSFGSLYQRVDDATVASAVNSTTWQFCNPGAVAIPAGISGPYTPNPSNIFVTNFPGTLNTMSLTLNNFSLDQTAVWETGSLIEGPTGAALDFFSNVGGPGNEVATQGNYVFEDSASNLVYYANPNEGTNIVPGTYKPTSEQPYETSADTFFSSVSGFYNVPGSFSLAAPKGSSTFGDVFTSGSNPIGTWSLFFNQYGADTLTGAANGWCLQLSENAPEAAVTLPSTSTFSQGQQNAQFTVDVVNNGPGSTGDPTAGSNPLTLTDNLNSAFTYSTFSGSGWSCSASGQNVTCTNDSPVAQGDSYPVLTLEVNVAANAEGTINNSVSVSGAGVASTPSNTDAITIQQVPASITIDGSQTQSAAAGTAFGSLAVTIKDGGGSVIPNYASVVFTAPSSGASGTFSNTSNTTTVSANGSGVADPGVFTANDTGGPYSVTVTAGSASTAFSLTNTVTTPTITWTPATTIIFGSAGANVLDATASCGAGCGTISYTATPGGGSPVGIASTSGLAVGAYTITANFSPSNPQYGANSATSPLTVSGESVWIVVGGGGTSELAGNGYGITSSVDPGANAAVAIDNAGNVWTAGTGSTPLEETSQVGTGPSTPTGGGLDLPVGIAIDGNSNVWVTNGNNSVSLFSNAGTALSPSGGFTDTSLSTPSGIAIDLGGSVWIVNKGNSSVTRILGAAAPMAPLSTAAANNTTGAKP